MLKKKLPYLIKKIATVAGFEVWLVDGDYIRQHVNSNFCNFGQHGQFHFIPSKMFFISKERRHDESKYYIEHMLKENALMAKGVSYDEANAEGTKAESKLRAKDNKFTDKDIKIKILYQDKYITIWEVNGHAVRNLKNTLWTQGATDKTHDFIPHGEVWIDDDVFKQQPVEFHELNERILLNAGMDYPTAHRISLLRERKLRNGDGVMRTEIKEVRQRQSEVLTPNHKHKHLDRANHHTPHKRETSLALW